MKINVWLYSLALLLRNLIMIKAVHLFFLKKAGRVLYLPHAQMLFFEISYNRVTKPQKHILGILQYQFLQQHVKNYISLTILDT